jgi:hypothetical protein
VSAAYDRAIIRLAVPWTASLRLARRDACRPRARTQRNLEERNLSWRRNAVRSADPHQSMLNVDKIICATASVSG